MYPSSFIFSLSGKNTSELSAKIHPPIELDPNSNYALALIGFHTFNSIPNVEEGENVFL